jgi:hypothetical protein
MPIVYSNDNNSNEVFYRWPTHYIIVPEYTVRDSVPKDRLAPGACTIRKHCEYMKTYTYTLNGLFQPEQAIILRIPHVSYVI